MDQGKRPRRLSQKERKQLEALMEARDPGLEGPIQASATRLHGFLTAIVSGPLVRPSEWIPIVFQHGESDGWKTMREAKRAMTLVMRFYNEIVADLSGESGRYGLLFDRIGDPPDTVDFADDWCKGYVAGMALRENDWKAATTAPELRDAFAPILMLAYPDRETLPSPFDQPEEYGAIMQALPQSALDIYDWWRTPRTMRRSSPKISANSPCPCGSGKKYKRCCSPLRAV